jgi:ATP-dependent exoDNAse (exonuclease V) beta subunit
MSNVSFSALKIWKDCPYKYKLAYIDKIEGFKGNEHTAFGTALHEACEKKLLDTSLNEQAIFNSKFEEELKNIFKDTEYNSKLINEMKEQGNALAPLIIPALQKEFGNFTILNTEEELLHPLKEIANSDRNFKGYIDLILKAEDGRIIILDWKTCSWGWDIEKKSDALTSYQLTYYKHFYMLKHNIDPKNIETYFGLLKRTAKKDRVELFRVTSGPKKVQNALKLLNDFTYNIDKNFFPKNRMSCENCDFKINKACT